MRSTLLAAAILLLPAACAHRPMAVVLSFGVCPVTQAPDGADVDDGGVDVAANVATDLAPAPRRLAATHFPGGCQAAPIMTGGLPALTCSDPHIDIVYTLAWTRPSARTLVLERREVPTADGEAAGTPAVRLRLAEVAIDRVAWVNGAPRTTCDAAP